MKLAVICALLGALTTASTAATPTTLQSLTTKTSRSTAPIASVSHVARGKGHGKAIHHYSYFRIYGKDFNHTLFSPDCPAGRKTKCVHNGRGRGLKEAFLECAPGRLEQWEYMDGGRYLVTPDHIEWDFWIEGKVQHFSHECMNDAIEAAGGPEADQVIN